MFMAMFLLYPLRGGTTYSVSVKVKRKPSPLTTATRLQQEADWKLIQWQDDVKRLLQIKARRDQVVNL
jgi:hypothetical protein